MLDGVNMKVVGLFAGIGGFEVGLSRAGHKTLLTCESWDAAKSVLGAHLSGIPNHADIRDLKGLPADTEVVCPSGTSLRYGEPRSCSRPVQPRRCLDMGAVRMA